MHCLAGTNGCGKSTLIKAIAGGINRMTAAALPSMANFGRLSPDQARAFGIQVIYQDLSLFSNLTVAENIAFEHNLRGLLGWHRPARLRRTAERLLQELSLISISTNGWRSCRLPSASRWQSARAGGGSAAGDHG